MFSSPLTVWLSTVHVVSILSFVRGEDVVFITSGNVTRASKGGNVTLTCLGDFKEQNELVWLKDNQPVPLQGVAPTRNETEDNCTRTLTITNVNLSDSGYYTCQTSSANATTLLVVDIPASVRIFKQSMNGKGVLLECIVDGLPKPVSRWKVVTEYGERKLISYRENKTLIIFAKDSGSYVCVAFNRAGSATAKVEILPSLTGSMSNLTDQAFSSLVSVTPREKQQGSAGPSVVLILVVIGCVVVAAFIAFAIHTLARNCCFSGRVKSDESPCGSGLMFMKANLRANNGLFGLSPRLTRRQEKGQASRSPKNSSRSHNEREKNSSVLSVDVAHSKSLEETRDLECQRKSSRDKCLNRPVPQQSKGIRETAV